MYELSLLISYYVQLLAIMNPFAAIPTFLSLTDHMDEIDRRNIVTKAFYASLILVVLFTLIGNYILIVFSISIPSLRIGGGILLMAIALDMLSGMPRTKQIEASDIAVVPLATPMIIGPGTITTILLLTASMNTVINTILVLVASILAASTTFLLLRYSSSLVKLLRVSVVRAIGRFMSLIIASVAVEMIAAGINSFYHEYMG
jgi:multiple antibiotic resistance protein